MDREQRRAIALALFAVAGILFVFYFVRPLWAWATWDKAHGTLDLGIVRFSNRPPFPSDVRSVVVGLVLPVVLAALGRVTGAGGRSGG